MADLDAAFDSALGAALDAFAAPGCSTQEVGRINRALHAAAVVAAGRASVSGARLRRLQECLAMASDPSQAQFLITTALIIAGIPDGCLQIAATPGIAAALAALLQCWPAEACAGTAADLLSTLMAALASDQDYSEHRKFATALLAAPGDAVGALLAVAAGAADNALDAPEARRAQAAALTVHAFTVCGRATALDGGRLLVCTGCRSVRFCSEECQKLGWKGGHKAQCAALKAARLQQAQQEAPAPAAAGGER
ncbi:MAG: hypothetical protein J3K34DRAFT_519422 [Monoraphidium minutum]|nr:MAG: hypothetical protein J3K34DRAFT_519422 [Monoraphidium minutum]